MSLPERIALGIDIGGTKMALGLVDQAGRIVASQVIATEAERGFERAVSRIIETGKMLTARYGIAASELAGVGIGCTGPVDPRRGTIDNPYTLEGWDNCDIVSPLRDALGLEVRLENDADAAAVGEWVAGAGRGIDRLVMLTFGTGIGGAVLLGGQIYRGCDGAHPEPGHLPVDASGPKCYCGINGCIESIAAGPAIHQAARDAGLIDARDAFTRASAGDARAAGVIERVQRAVGVLVCQMLHTFLPERILFGGGLMEEHYAVLTRDVRKIIAAATMVPAGKVGFAPAMLGNSAGMIGAAALVWQRAG
jgi:glucokinase